MNSDEIWLLQLWSGAFAAAGSGVVAVLVLHLSNRHQSKLAETARRQAAHVAAEQLEAQEKALRLQLEEQQAEATRARYLAAAADFITAVETGVNTFRRGGDFEDVFVQMESARVRMFFDSNSRQLMEELEAWPVLIWELCRAASAEHEVRIDDGAPFTTLNNASAALTAIVSRWHESSSSVQESMLKKLREVRETAGEAAEVYRELLHFARTDRQADY